MQIAGEEKNKKKVAIETRMNDATPRQPEPPSPQQPPSSPRASSTGEDFALWLDSTSIMDSPTLPAGYLIGPYGLISPMFPRARARIFGDL
jgi:hypothetical protein